jgi:hypothetical protein
MPPIFSLIAAAIASIPGLALSYYIVSGRRFASAAQAWAGFMATASRLLPIYITGAFLYGLVLWFMLRAINQLNLPGLLVGSVVPVFVIVLGHAVTRRGGPGSGLHIVLFAFSLPCLVMAFTLWLFSIWRHSGT